MVWTRWLKVAEGRDYFNKNIPQWEGPACYELGTQKPRGSTVDIKYVGETTNLKIRISSYARNGSHLEYYIDDALRMGKSLFYRYQRKDSKEDAMRMQNNLLLKYDYPWNYQRNCD
ncbi:MAG: hypothetical protein JXA08_03890 [Methanomicrobiaceae archaeon]|nr:hypothetical protein [Methanomicrobiaceae archaeon]